MNHWKVLYFLIIPCLILACAGNTASDVDSNDNDEEVEELSEFGEMVRENFEEKGLPYACNRCFDNYKPEEFLTESEYKKLELFYVFPEYKEKCFTAEHWIQLETGITAVVVTSKDNEMELSTYLVTFNEDEWYVANIRLGYEHNLIGMKISSKIENDKITRTIHENHGDEIVKVVEDYYIRADGSIDWEGDILGDDIQ